MNKSYSNKLRECVNNRRYKQSKRKYRKKRLNKNKR